MRKKLHEQKHTDFDIKIRFSIIVPLFNTHILFLTAMLNSVRRQTYSDWELCLADGSDEHHKLVGLLCRFYSKFDERIKYSKLQKNLGISENTNAAIGISTGDYIVLLDHDDILHPALLFKAMQAICYKNGDFIYTDEVTFRKRISDAYLPNFKPDFAPDTLRSCNYICHCTIFKKALLAETGLFDPEYDGSQDHDMILRLTEKAHHIIHIPEILYYWRASRTSVASDCNNKSYAFDAGRKAVMSSLDRLGLEGEISSLKQCGSMYRIKYKISGEPKISIIIPNYEHIDDLKKCISSIFLKTTYSNFEIIIVENNSTSEKIFDYYRELTQMYSNVKVVFWNGVFNYSAINNYAAGYADGDYYLLLNNDIEVITPDWIQEMLMFVQRKDVGAAGAKLYYSDDTIQHAGVIIGMGGFAGHSFIRAPKDSCGSNGRLLYAQDLSAVTGACMMVRKDVWKQVCGLNEDLAVAFNDIDLCLKIRQAGYLIVWTPFAELYHYESKSRGLDDTPEKIRRFRQEVEYCQNKWSKELESGDPYFNPNFSLENSNLTPLDSRYMHNGSKKSGDLDGHLLRTVIMIMVTAAASILILNALDNSFFILFPLGLTILCLILYYFFPQRVKKTAGSVFRYRWVYALMIFITAVFFQLHGSSIGEYDRYFPPQAERQNNILFGETRSIRSDEYGVQTPTFFSQRFNGYNQYSQMMSLSPINMTLDYYSPVRNLMALGKPMMWGYLFFGNAIGLSWYWSSMEILLFMLALEMFLIITEKKRLLSITGAAMLLYSPAIQWWMMPHMPVVILYSMGLFAVGYHFFMTEHKWMRMVYGSLAIIAATGFAISIFPSFQVPCFYIVAALLFCTLCRDRSGINFTHRDLYQIFIPMIITALVVGYFIITSEDDIKALMSTVYPGKRMNCGGNISLRNLFTDPTSVFLPFKDINYANNCEVSSYIHFAPLFLFLFPKIYYYQKHQNAKNNIVGLTLLIILLVEIIYMCCGISPLWAKITQFKYCNRMLGVYGWSALIFTVWGLSVLWENSENLLNTKEKILYPVLFVLINFIILDTQKIEYFKGFHNIGLFLLFSLLCLFGIIIFLAVFNERKLCCYIIFILMIVAGFTVNPIARGIGPVVGHPISRAIQEISSEEPDSRWMCTDCIFFIPNFVMANGARVLNATNFYEDKEKWEIIDPERKLRNLTNRYANQSTSVSECGNRVRIVNPDYIHYDIDPNTIKKLEIKYLLSTVNYSELLKKYSIRCCEVMSQGDYTIYRLEY